LQLFGDIVHGASNDAEMTWLFDRLDLAVYLTIAWTAGNATGRDFARSGTEIASMFGPALRAQDTPDYGQRPSRPDETRQARPVNPSKTDGHR